MKKYIDRFSKDGKSNFNKYVGTLIHLTNLHKLEQLAKYFDTTTDVILDKLIDTAYLQVPKELSNNKVKRLIIPTNITEFRDLMNYLDTDFNNHNQFTFNLHSYNLLAEDIKRHKIAPSNLRDYLKHMYPTTTVTIKD